MDCRAGGRGLDWVGLGVIRGQHLLSVRHVSAHDKRNLLLAHFLDGDLKRIRLTFQVDEYRRIHATTGPASAKVSTDGLHREVGKGWRRRT